MASVYQNAWLVVGATASANSSQGCFKEREQGFGYTFKVPGSIPSDLCTIRGAIVRKEEESITYSPPVEAGQINPLDKRAWALQESVLPNRLLLYRSSGLEWRC